MTTQDWKLASSAKAKGIIDTSYSAQRRQHFFHYSLLLGAVVQAEGYLFDSGKVFGEGLCDLSRGTPFGSPKEERLEACMKIKTDFFNKVIALEREFMLWLDRLKTVFLHLSNDRLVLYGDFYRIRVFDKSNQQSCSIYTLNSWIERHDILDVTNYQVKECTSDCHPRNFSGKQQY